MLEDAEEAAADGGVGDALRGDPDRFIEHIIGAALRLPLGKPAGVKVILFGPRGDGVERRCSNVST